MRPGEHMGGWCFNLIYKGVEPGGHVGGWCFSLGWGWEHMGERHFSWS